MTYTEWMQKAALVPVPNDRRLGEHWLHQLWDVREDLIEEVCSHRGTNPYLDDKNLNRFFQFVREVW